MNTDTEITGHWKHFKGGEYDVLGIATHSETLEELVVYRACYGDKKLWVRPKEMFLGTTTVRGEEVRRFTKVV